MNKRKCFYCGQTIYGATRSDQIFCNKYCRYRYYHPAPPKCSKCLNKHCKHYGVYKGKLSPRDCPDRA